MTTVGPSPPLEILVRDPEGYSLWNGPPFTSGKPNVKLERTPCTSAKFSEDGSRMMVMKFDSVISIYDCHTYKEIRSFEVPNVLAATVSPCGTYLQTFQKSTTPQEKNIVLWKTETGDSAYDLFQKNMTKATWPSIRFSNDETLACRLATNEIHFFYGTDFSKGFTHKLRVQGVAAVELSKTPGSHVAAFVPESKGVPASVQIFSPTKELQGDPVARQSCFRCSSVQLSWNSGSTGLLVVVQSDVDKTNQSYYGESKLHYLTIDGTQKGLINLRKEGPIHDVQWSYSGNEFAVVYGFMPAKATVFDRKCKILLELGTGPYNTVRWNPKGKFICLSGFGNLPGEIAFWDYTENKQLGTTKAEWSVTSEWSPDGLYFMTATTAPRLQVDNGIKFFHHNGSLYYKKMFDKLYQVDWKPVDLIKSVSSVKIEESKPQVSGQMKNSSQTSTKAASCSTPAQKPAAYRPPQMKQAAAIQAQLRGENPSDQMSKNALKNKKKREKQREKKAADGANDE